MSRDDFILAEYQSLRAEILQISAQLPMITRYTLAVMLALYAAPFALKSPDVPTTSISLGHGFWGWVLVMLGVDFVIIALAQRFIVSSIGMRRVGSYLAEILEPKTGGALEYETAVFGTLPLKTSRITEAGSIIMFISGVHVLAAGIVGGAIVQGSGVLLSMALAGLAVLPACILLSIKRSREALFDPRAERTAAITELKAWRATQATAASGDGPK
jgi:hypothetical protein